MKRYHVVQGEPTVSGGHEWDVLDRHQKHKNCEGCPGIAVATLTSRRLARAVCTERNAQWYDEQQAAIDEQHYNGCGDPK